MKRFWRVGLAIALLLLSAPLVAAPPPIVSVEQLVQTGDSQFQAGAVEAAIQSWRQAQQQFQQNKNFPGAIQLSLKLGAALVNQDRHQEAISVLEESLPLMRHLQDQRSEAQALGNLGIAYQELGRYARAIVTHRQAGKLMLQLGDRQNLGQVLTNLGNTFVAVGDYSNATIAFQQSLKIAQQLGDRSGESIVLGNLGAIYANQGKDQEAIALFQKSLDLAKAIHHIPSQASALLNLGSTYHALRQVDRAIAYYQDSLKLAQASGDRIREAEALGALGLVYEDKNQFPEAIRHHEKSLAIGRSLNNPDLEGRAQNNLGHTLFNAGKLKEAEAVLQQAIQQLDALRPDLSDRYKVSIFDTQLHTYSLLQQVFIAAKKYDAALEAAEWGRARAFAEQLARRVGGRGQGAGGGEQGVGSREQGVGSREQRETMKGVGSPSVFSPQSSSNQIAPIRMADIRRIAKEQRSTLVEYAIVPDDDFKFRGKQRGREAELLIWVVQPSGKLHFRRVDLKPLWKRELDLGKLVLEGRNCLYPATNCQAVAVQTSAGSQASGQPSGKPSANSNEKPQRRVNPALHHLYHLLIQPIADLLPTNPDERVIFLPLESLFLVPFPALQRADGTYLIERHTVLTAPAIQVLALTRQIKQQRQVNKPGRDRWLPALIVGNPTMPKIDGQALDPLPAAEEEAKQIAELLQAKAWIGAAATQTTIVQQMKQVTLIHLATHGLLEYGQTLGETDLPGAIALAPTSALATGKPTTGILTASEILDLPLKANLVVLSACDTGQGRITGDGVQGLSRAFIAAGVPSLVVSLWAVPDTSTAYLMVQFYENLLRQPDKAKALRLAMLDTMTTYPRPLDWAAFTLIGESE